MPPRASRHLAARGVVAVAVLTVLAASPVLAGDDVLARGVVGRGLHVEPALPMMQPVNAPATIARVAAVPGSPVGEAWAIGFTHTRRPSYDLVSEAGQAVFLRHTRDTGWRVWGPPVRSDGRPMNELLSDLAVTADGEGWAVGAQGAMYHRAPGGGWILEPERLTTHALFDVSLGTDARGVYGYAVGANLTILRLGEQGWELDQPSGAAPGPGNTVPTLGSVAAIDRERGFAISGNNSNNLIIFRRANGAWQRVLTGSAMFDQPPAPVWTGAGTTVNQLARGASIAADGDEVWIGGMMQPIDPARPTGSTTTTDRTRPFVLRTDTDGSAFRSYCPSVYQVSSAGVESTVQVCDAHFPFATGSLPALAAVDGRVFAGGFGLFGYDGRTWTREPNTAGFIVSAAFTSARDGWVASPGDVFSGGGFASSTSIALGHWTDEPVAPSIRRWAHPDDRPLEAVALAPDGSDEAIAVGQDGAIVALRDGAWDVVSSPTREALHALSWPARDRAYAVGSNGTIISFDGRSWRVDGSDTTGAHLYALAFDGARGIAVGAGGTILRYDGSWRADPASGRATTRDLYGVAFAGDTIVAVGAKGTLLEHSADGWRAITGLGESLKTGGGGSLPNLLSIAASPDGRALIGGSRSALLERTARGSYRIAQLGHLEGSIHALAMRARGDALDAVASVGAASTRVQGTFITQGSGWLFARDRDGWRDLSLAHASGSVPDLDAPALHDAIYGIALSADGRTGWAVGGFPDGIFSDDGHQRTASTASIWRVDLVGTPAASPAEESAPLPVETGVRFAFLGDSACGSSFCSAVLGSGARGDSILLEALRQIDDAARDGVVRFAGFGGDVRRNGFPDELEPVESLFRELSIPVYGALGDKDLFAGVGPAIGDQQGGVLSTNGYALRTFADMPAPWGHAPAPSGIRPVRLVGHAQAATSHARSHYAFDLTSEDGAIRVVVLDTSVLPLASNLESQNPREEQTTWLESVLTDARTRALPAVVLMHQPAVLPISTAGDASTITSILTAGGASAVLASHRRVNETHLAPDGAVPDPIVVGLSGGAGSPLQAKHEPARGGYHSWLLVSIDPDPARRSAANRAPITIHSIPILASMALHAPQGRTTGSGDTLPFRALGRLPDVGGPHGIGRNADPDQGNATYLSFPFPRPCALLEQPERDGCRQASVTEPSYRFWTSDPDVATFVRADPARPSRPFRDARGRLVRDERSGLLCTFGPGVTEVRAAAGVVAARATVTVTAGSGPCTPAVFAPEVPAGSVARTGEHVPAPEDESLPPHVLRQRVPEPAAVAAVAPPIVNAAPAPPGGGAGQRQEEQEAASERADYSAPGMRARRPAPTTATGVATAFLVSALAFSAAVVTRPRRRSIPAFVRPDPTRRNR